MKRVIFILLMFGATTPANAQIEQCSVPIKKLLFDVKQNSNYDEQFPAQLLLSKAFVSLKVCAPKRFHDYLEILPTLSMQDTRILLYASQSLKGQQYLDFASALVEAVNNHRVDNSVLKSFIFPGYDWNTLLIENYNAPKVVKLLSESAKVLGDNDSKKNIQNILTGLTLESLIKSRFNQHTRLSHY